MLLAVSKDDDCNPDKMRLDPYRGILHQVVSRVQSVFSLLISAPFFAFVVQFFA